MNFITESSATVFTFFIINLIVTSATDLSEGTLVAASVIFRHGDRTPINPYPTDPYKDRKFWPVGFGQLTNTGKKQHYELGKWLRKRYNSLVSEKYDPDEMVVQSTDLDRTLMSALSDLSGFYPPKGSDIWSDDINNWQPIPVHTVPESMDKILEGNKCPAYDIELKKLLNTTEFKALDEKYKPLYAYLTSHTGRTVDSFVGVQYLYSCLYIEQIYNYTLPEWTNKVYPGKMLEVTNLAFAIQTYTKLLARLKAGPLLKEILNHFKNKTENILEPNRNLWIYSAHDTNIANIMNTLGVYEPMGYPNIPYASALLFELIQKQNGFFVQIYFKNSTDPVLLDLPNCGKSCALSEILENYKAVLPDNWEEECGSSLLQSQSDLNLQVSLSFMVILGLIILLVIGSILLLIAMSYRKQEYLIKDEISSFVLK